MHSCAKRPATDMSMRRLSTIVALLAAVNAASAAGLDFKEPEIMPV